MEKFDFSIKDETNTTGFNGSKFYYVYKHADFLRVNDNIETILSRGYLLRQVVNSHPIGHSVLINGMQLATNTPLIVKRAGKGVTVKDFEFTYNRLAGLVAAYAYENRQMFPILESSEAKALGLVWNNQDKKKCKLYLSAVSGTDNMVVQFSFFPFLCGLRKYQLNKIPLELVVGMGYVKNDKGITMARVMMNNLVTAKRIWLMFPTATIHELEKIINDTPKLKIMCQG